MVGKIVVGTIFLAAVACMGIALFYFASAMFSARSEFAAKKRGYVLDLVPLLLLTPFAYNKVGRSFIARAICYGIMSGLLIFLSGVVGEALGDWRSGRLTRRPIPAAPPRALGGR